VTVTVRCPTWRVPVATLRPVRFLYWMPPWYSIQIFVVRLVYVVCDLMGNEICVEYAYTLKVNEKSDVYSFGVVLLELVTGKKAVDPRFGDNKDIVKWVMDCIASKSAEVDLHFLIDPRLQPVSSYEYEEMVRVLHVGLLCTSAFPMNRPSMRRVVELLRDPRDVSFSAPDFEKQ